MIAKTLKVSEEAIRLWVNALLLKGVEDLISNKGPGRPPKLTKTQKEELRVLATSVQKYALVYCPHNFYSNRQKILLFL